MRQTSGFFSITDDWSYLTVGQFQSDEFYTGCKCIIWMFPFVHFIFTSFATHELYVVEDSGIFGQWEPVGVGWGWASYLRFYQPASQTTGAFATLCGPHCTWACVSLPEWWYFLDKMLQAPRVPLNIAAVTEREETSVNVVSGVRGSPWGGGGRPGHPPALTAPAGGRSSWGRPAGCASHASPFHVRCFRKRGNRKGE